MSSDLIERLEEATNEYHAAGKFSAKERAIILANLIEDNIDTILSALKTVQGIEAAKRILIEWDEEVKVWRVNTYTSEGWQSGKTLAAAVEAAGKKGEGR